MKQKKFSTSMGAKCVILITKTTCYVWMDIHICNDVDSGQDIKKATKSFYGLVTRRFVMRESIHICSDVDSGQDMEKAT